MLKVKVCTELKTHKSKGFILSQIPQFEGVSIKCALNVSTETVEQFYLKGLPGEGVVYLETVEDFYLDLNKNGELVIISPPQYNFFINNSGELIIERE